MAKLKMGDLSALDNIANRFFYIHLEWLNSVNYHKQLFNRFLLFFGIKKID